MAKLGKLPLKRLVTKPDRIRKPPLTEDIQRYIELIQKHIAAKGIDSAIDEFGIDDVYEATRFKSRPKQS
jgi:hypothetical protein